MDGWIVYFVQMVLRRGQLIEVCLLFDEARHRREKLTMRRHASVDALAKFGFVGFRREQFRRSVLLEVSREELEVGVAEQLLAIRPQSNNRFVIQTKLFSLALIYRRPQERRLVYQPR